MFLPPLSTRDSDFYSAAPAPPPRKRASRVGTVVVHEAQLLRHQIPKFAWNVFVGKQRSLRANRRPPNSDSRLAYCLPGPVETRLAPVLFAGVEGQRFHDSHNSFISTFTSRCLLSLFLGPSLLPNQEIHFLFSMEDSRDAFKIPHDLKIFKEVFNSERATRDNAFWKAFDLPKVPSHVPLCILDSVTSDERNRGRNCKSWRFRVLAYNCCWAKKLLKRMPPPRYFPTDPGKQYIHVLDGVPYVPCAAHRYGRLCRRCFFTSLPAAS